MQIPIHGQAVFILLSGQGVFGFVIINFPNIITA